MNLQSWPLLVVRQHTYSIRRTMWAAAALAALYPIEQADAKVVALSRVARVGASADADAGINQDSDFPPGSFTTSFEPFGSGESASASASGDGERFTGSAMGSGTGQISNSLSFDQSGGLREVTASGSASSSATSSAFDTRFNQPVGGAGGGGHGNFVLSFEVTDEPVNYSYTASAGAMGDGANAGFLLQDSSRNRVAVYFANGNGTFDGVPAGNGMLPVGEYLLSGGAASGSRTTQNIGAGSSSFNLRIAFELLSPPPTDVIRWINSAGGAFGTASNWTPQEMPGSSNTALFDLPSNYTVDVNSASTNRLIVRAGNLTLNIAGTYIASELSPQTPSVSIELDGNLTIRAGQLRGIHASIGSAATADPATTAKVNVARLGGVASEWINSGNLAIGGLGAGQLTVNMGGFVQSGAATIGGIPGRGDVIVSGEGSKWVSGNLQIARNAGPGSLTIENKGRVESSEVNIGFGGEGQVNVRTGGSLSVSTDLILDGVMNVGGVGPGGGSPAGVSILEDFTIGFNRSGTLRVEDGGNVIAIFKPTIVGNFFDSQVRVAGMAGGFQSSLLVDELHVGSFAKGEVTVENGGWLSSRKARVGTFLGDGRVTIEGRNGTQSSTWDTESLQVGASFADSTATAEVHVKSGGSLSVGKDMQGDLRLDGLLTVAGAGGPSLVPSSVYVAGRFDIGFNRAGTLRVEDGGGVISLFNKVVVGTFTDATVHISGVHSSGTPSIFTAGTELTVGLVGKATVTVENGASLISGMASVGSLAADGTVTIRGVNGTHRSEWHVQGNLLLGASEFAMATVSVENGALLDVDGAFLIGPNGHLEGNGEVVTGSISNVGFVVPEGNSPGILTFDSDYTQSDSGRLHIEVGGFTPGVQLDQLIVTGDATLGGTLILQFIDGFAPKTGDTFNFLDVVGSIMGEFDNVEIRNLQPGFQFDIRPGAGGLTMVALSDGVFVPEPSSVSLLIVAALGCFRRLRRSS